MFPHLIGLAKTRHLSEKQLGNIIGCSRQSYSSKLAKGTFTIKEANALMEFFDKNFEYLFATDDTKEA